jgi:hypothetical protein
MYVREGSMTLPMVPQDALTSAFETRQEAVTDITTTSPIPSTPPQPQHSSQQQPSPPSSSHSSYSPRHINPLHPIKPPHQLQILIKLILESSGVVVKEDGLDFLVRRRVHHRSDALFFVGVAVGKPYSLEDEGADGVAVFCESERQGGWVAWGELIVDVEAREMGRDVPEVVFLAGKICRHR